MDPVKKEEILNDLEAFSNGKEYYKKFGKAWKRGYLLYGPPGTEQLGVEETSRSRSIIVIEDIDCSVDLTGKRRKSDGYLRLKKDGEQGKEDQSQSRVTLSGLLNFIYGIWSACGQERIIIFTTNHIEKLDPALIRRGRMDMLRGVQEKLMAKNHKIDVDGSLKDLVESLERRKKHQREHGDDHKKKLGGKKLKILSGLFSF
ncbi:hypothetical protein DY000_02019303 [Brassica cretica]|nr:hypothetical protein DY000_02019303 [Brassica cretica]